MSNQGILLFFNLPNDGFFQPGAVEHLQQNIDQQRPGSFHFRTGVGQRQVGQGGLASLTGPVEIKDNDGNDSHQTADMLFFDTASMRWQAPGIICEEMAMALLDASILMAAGRCHEGDVSFQKIVCVVGTVLVDRFDEQAANFDI